MASLSVPHSLHSKIRLTHELGNRRFPVATSNLSVSCRTHEPGDPEKPGMKKDRGIIPSPMPGILGGLEKLGKGLKGGLSPQRKGDWKDLTLMSLSFAVYVYMSQKIVCAYYAWVHMPKQPW